MPWGRLSLWKWVPGISPGVKAADAFGWRATTLLVPQVEKILGLNLPGTPKATPACCRVSLLFTFSYSSCGTWWHTAENILRLSPKRMSPFKSEGASVQSTAGSRGVRISLSNAGYTTFGGGVRVLVAHSIRQFRLHFPSRASPCATRF